MPAPPPHPLPALGVVGLGTMGAALARNFAEKGVALALHDADAARTKALAAELGARGAATPAALVAALTPPRAILLMVPAGEAVDAALAALAPRLAAGDAVIDGGNSFWKDTERRVTEHIARGVHVLGFGVSGGEDGARSGPAIMAGGDDAALARVAPEFARIAASADGAPCLLLAGPGGAGHFVKMVHNGIEYVVMQLIAEAYLLLRDVGGFDSAAIGRVFGFWRDGPADSFLLDCARRALAAREGEAALVDLIADRAGQKGTGAWTTAAALEFGVPAPTLAEAVFARGLSGLGVERLAAGRALAAPTADVKRLAADLRVALPAAALAASAQGFALIAAASAARGWGIDPAAVARGWRAGCILRAALTDRIAVALTATPAAPNLLALPDLVPDSVAEAAWRRVVEIATRSAAPVPCFGSALAYLDGYRTARSGANLIEAMRDVFGRHGFARADRDGRHHADWPPT